MWTMVNPVRHHSWGSQTAIPSLLGTQPDGTPHAELWLSAHEGESSSVRVGAQDRLLCEVLAESSAGRLPFLAKVLAIGSPLSLQLHPGSGDDVKPEMLFALEPCRTLCGFRSAAAAKAVLRDLPPLRPLATAVTDQQDSLRAVMAELLASDAGVVDATAAALRDRPRWAATASAVDELRTYHRSDPASLAPVLLEPVTLRPGEAVFCAPGQPHTYVRGLGFEVQASSDAVVRAGLTDKAVDVPRFLSELDTSAGASRVPSQRDGPEDVFDPGVSQFALGAVRTSQGALAHVAGAQILLCAGGSFTVSDGGDTVALARGDAVFVPGPAAAITAYGDGLLLRVSAGRAR